MTQDLVAAATEAQAALAAGDSRAVHYNTLAWDRAVGGDAAAAAAFFRQALALAPLDPEALVGLAGLARAAGRLSEAVRYCDSAIAAAPTYPEAWLERAFVMHAGGAMAEARECYARVVALAPTNGAAHAGLAAIAAREGDYVAASKHANAALSADPDNAIAATALATIALEDGQAESAYKIIAPLAARRPKADAERVQLFNILGDARSKLGDTAGAYVAYAQSKTDFAQLHAALVAGRPPHRAWIEAINAALPMLDPEQWPRPGARSAKPCEQHVFVMGYPRSGNTMLENVLASLPDVFALEEHPTFRSADRVFLAEPATGLAQLQALDEAAAAEYREEYWALVTGAGGPAASRGFVDMDPLKGTRLPLIARLFPDARILFLRRDPRDVVWSCFRTNFALTNAAMDFVSLEGTARHYAALMTLIEHARARLRLAVHEVKYEALVQNFDHETQAICAFAGLEWSEKLRRFDRTAVQRGVSTASAGQVRKGLYDGSGQWRPYAEYLAPVMPILSPWIERFGYEA